jgi:hypothetical protein
MLFTCLLIFIIFLYLYYFLLFLQKFSYTFAGVAGVVHSVDKTVVHRVTDKRASKFVAIGLNVTSTTASLYALEQGLAVDAAHAFAHKAADSFNTNAHSINISTWKGKLLTIEVSTRIV